MKILACIALVLALIGCGRNDTGEIPRISPGTPYSEARSYIIESGWTPVDAPESMRRALQEYPESITCDDGQVCFKFIDRLKSELYVHSSGNPPMVTSLRYFDEASAKVEAENAQRAAEEEYRKADEVLAQLAAENDEVLAQLAAENADPFPYTAVITCGMDGFENQVILQACMKTGEIELTNGDDYGMYKGWNFPREWSLTKRGIEIPLAKSFSLKIENSERNLLLGVRIFDKSGKIIFRKLASRYQTIDATNF
jgi:hypothetical protein